MCRFLLQRHRTIVHASDDDDDEEIVFVNHEVGPTHRLYFGLQRGGCGAGLVQNWGEGVLAV